MPGMERDGGHRIALLLEYDGARYAGSQFQTDAPTIQGELEAAIRKTTGEEVRVAFAGRTDAGVHALGQVAAFTTMSALALPTMRNALNAWLPEDIAVKAVAGVDPDFDPRRHAVRRHYRYVIDNDPVRPAIGRQYAWHVAPPLDDEAMAEAAHSLTGEHDFAAFAGPPEEPASAVRKIDTFDVRREASRLFLDVAANAFLRHQVRRMAGALAQVGLGRITPAEYRGLLQGRPASAGPAAPARGLFLVRVEYARELFGAGEEPASGTAADRLPWAG